MNISFTASRHPKKKPEDHELSFGTRFTDHMLLMDYSLEKGWHDLRIVPYDNFSLPPSTTVFHYGQAIFEGLKAYRRKDNQIQLFRAKDNFDRFNRSARRMCIPEIERDSVLDALKELIRIEEDWVPSSHGTSLYIRPTIIATDPFLGIRASHTYLFFTILSPVGAYYPEGFNPVKIWVTSEYVRAVPGGVGEAKTAGNYAASLYASEKAQKEGYTQVLWLDGKEHRYIEEVGSMNIFFVINNTIVTPELNGSILSGVTRNTVIQVARKNGLSVSEKRISIDEICEAHEKGELSEAFGSGTAAVISPVGTIRYKDHILTIKNGVAGPISTMLFDEITGIQYGEKEDSFQWTEII
ncbi:branched chain amino acid aminotransferase apoenzyme [Desulfobotulus alkaliphilus]|uniref:Branched-chain-amino-acid aminotransferase n=1 Tax=Desulfobotulus alkaliphilus TaxID=622671 RepID=A0A562S2C8_9BACT|nr:branched-chain amino acid aminotransferase [Desulfobotulus alkaliphilus]TWI75531.1 branched chain amino acid aminotransferase apoenzyme [Desulfobotulus alkaliphilus]